jgi:5,10-methylene-tetrahydrofolate dehydrogenase/methenyl tetrahydrofolate cyclohydrolase
VKTATHHTLCHSESKNLTDITKIANVLIVAIGKLKFVVKEIVKEDAMVVDVRMDSVKDDTRASGFKSCGNLNFNDVYHMSSAITPVPGSFGPMTVAMLMQNPFQAYRLTANAQKARHFNCLATIYEVNKKMSIR